jgi:SPP1 gp7 family putative phage head morphogenesis protein
LTFKERRKRADAQKIADDFESVESSFISFAQKLNKKRQAQMMKRIERVIPELIENKDNSEEVEGILQSLKAPSSKEWKKGIERLLFTATETGILRAHLEMLRLKELFEFDETWTPDVIDEGYNYDVVLPEEARKFIRQNAYEIGVITEETVINRIRKELEQGLDEGLPPKEMTARVKDTVGTWMSDWHAQTIARTETGKYYNAGRLARWTDPETNGFVEALQYDAILDTRTTEVCRHLDGRIISIENQATISEFTPPNHFQCRSTWLPVTRYEEWEDDFDTSVQPEKGFDFKSPLPKLLKGKKKGEKLVKPKPAINPLTETDPDVIRSMPDDDFRLAIGNITDQALKLSMVKERAEQMAVREMGLQEVRIPPQFMWYGFNSDAMKGSFEIYDELVEFYMTQEVREDIEDLVRELQGATDTEIDDILKRYEKKFAGSVAHMDIVRVIREVRKSAKTEIKFTSGLPEVKQTRNSEKLWKIKEPPKTANYKSATGLQQALKDGQAWIDKHLHPRLAPSSGIKMRFQNDLMRAYATGGNGEIFFGRYENNSGVIVHEAGHVMHWNSPEVSQLIETWFMERTNNLKLQWSKRHGEDVIPDDFYNSYIGRIYGWEEKNNRIIERQGGSLRFYGQEVLSMGLQAMHENPKRFYKDDKDHFLLTYAILRGLF